MYNDNTPLLDTWDEMYKLYNQATIFVSAAFTEGFNFPILEAMRCGTPVVCTDDGGSRDFVHNNENALLVSRNMPGIHLGVRRLLNDKALRSKLRAGGLRQARKPKYTWDNVTKHLLKVLNAI